MLLIDGSIMEGGGQILRIALTLSTLTKTPIKINNIRANRNKVGLAAQHLQGIHLITDICSAKVRGAHMGSMDLEFIPGVLGGGKYFADAKTAGSIALMLQVALPVTYFCKSPVILELRGGTNADMAPQIDFITEILRPNIENFGITFNFELLKRGYFPRGGGHTIFEISPVKCLSPIDLTNFGEVKNFFGWSFVAGRLPIKMAREMSEAAKDNIKQLRLNAPISIEEYKESFEVAQDNCSGIILGCKTTTNCIIGGSALGNRNENSYEIGIKAAREIISAITVKACVDEYVEDQLIVFMALAKGRSRIRTSKMTLHTKTAIYISELITKAKFSVTEDDQTHIIECDGIGMENIHVSE